MRIVHANKAYFPHLGGVETVVRNLAEGAAARSHDVTVVTADGPGPTVVDGIPVHRARSLAAPLSVQLAPGFPAALLRLRADVLHVHEPSVLPEVVLAAAGRAVRRRFDRVVLSWHSDIVRQRRLLTVAAPVLRRALARADVVLAATPHHVTTSPFLQGVADKVRIVPYGVDPARYDLTPEVARRVEAIRAELGTPLVLFLGRLVYYKGIGRLLDAAEALPEARFVLVGRGPLEGEVRASPAARRGQLVLLPPVDEAEKVALLHACDVFVLPSTDLSEAFGIVQVEAMACAKPVVTFDLPTGVTWVNRHDETGLVVPIAERGGLARGLAVLLGDDARRARLAAGASARVRDALTLDGQMEATLATYA